jgi:hypothetical protein
MDIRPIRNDQDHRAALAEIDACWGAPEERRGRDKLDVLVALVDRSGEHGKFPPIFSFGRPRSKALLDLASRWHEV